MQLIAMECPSLPLTPICTAVLSFHLYRSPSRQPPKKLTETQPKAPNLDGSMRAAAAINCNSKATQPCWPGNAFRITARKLKAANLHSESIVQETKEFA